MVTARSGAQVRRWQAGGISRWGDAGAIVVAVLIVGGPALFTHDAFMVDYTNHLWLVGVQEQAISHHLAPTYFISTSGTGVLYPFFMFYGGTLYAIGGGLAAVLGGHVVTAYVALSVLAIAAAYGGMVWTARLLGVRSWLAHAPAIAFVASAYYVTNIYGRGAWPEFVGTSMLPLLMASAWSIARSPRITLLPSVALVASAIAFAGSHNITLLLGTLTVLIAAILLLPVVGREAGLSGRGVLQVMGLLALSFGVDAWFLLPDVVHAGQTTIAGTSLTPAAVTAPFDTPGMLFNPLRSVPVQSNSHALYVQAPDWFLLWAVAAGVACWRTAGRRLRRSGLALVALLALLLLVIMVGPLWDALPTVVREAQFPYRLNTYVALCTAWLVALGALSWQASSAVRRRRAVRLGLMAAIMISVLLCVWQLWVPLGTMPKIYSNVDDVFVSQHALPLTWYDPGSYRDASEPVIPATRRTTVIAPGRISGDHVKLTVMAGRGRAPFATNIAAGPYAVKLGGAAEVYARTASGFMVLRRRRPGSGPLPLSLGPAGGAVAIGRVMSQAALCLLAVSLVTIAVSSRRSRRTSSWP